MIPRKLDWEDIPISKIKPYKSNPKRHPQSQVDLIAKSLSEYGWTQPICVDKTYTLIFGHCRLLAAQQLGEDTVPVVFREDLSTAQVKALRILDNKSNESEWDTDLLEVELAELQAFDYELEDVGFDLDELDDMRNANAKYEAKEDDFDVDGALEEEPVSKAGDLWLLGKHKVLCGDSIKAEDVARLMDGKKADMVISSPPYFNQRQYSNWKNYEEYLEFAKKVIELVKTNIALDSICAWNIGSDEPAYRWMPSDWWVIFRDSGWTYQESLAWVKSAAVWSVPRSMHIENGRYFPALRWEIILILKQGKHPVFEMKYRDNVREFQDNVWEIPVVSGIEQQKQGHPAIYPVKIPYQLIMAYNGQTILDPFLGSGTTLIAAAQLDRVCYGMEISPLYTDVCVKRYINHGSKTDDVFLERDGVKIPYSEVIKNV